MIQYKEDVYSYVSRDINIIVNGTERNTIDVFISGILVKQIKFTDWAEVPYLVEEEKEKAYLSL